jgi:hypothetical protein
MPSKGMVKARLSRLMVATQQVWEKHAMTVLSKDGWLGHWLAKSSGYDYTKASRYLSKLQHLKSKTSITPQSPIWRIDLTNKTNQAQLYQPNPSSTNYVRVHTAHDHEHGCYNSFTLCRGCTHSPWVAIILDSRIPVVQASTRTHFWVVC